MLAFLILVICAQAFGDTLKVYVYRDDKGVLVFTDKSYPGAKEVNLNQKVLTMPVTDTSIFDRLQTRDEGKVVNFQITITRPAQEATIRDNSGVVDISGDVTPELRSEHQIQLKLDGVPWQKPHSQPKFILRDVERGQHQVVLELIDNKGKVIATSPPHNFYLFRASTIKIKKQAS